MHNFNTHACHAKHPALPIVVGDKTYHIKGGSVTSPTPEYGSHEIIIPLDHGFAWPGKAMEVPWDDRPKASVFKGAIYPYLIPDMTAPTDAPMFKKMIAYVAEQVLAGKKVFVGCIGGHGRTGTVLVALVAHMTGNKDALAYVRKHYCKSAVETQTQLAFLKEHFGINGDGFTPKHSFQSFPKNVSQHPSSGQGKGGSNRYKTMHPMATARTLFGRHKV